MRVKTCSVPVHQASKPQTMLGIAVVMAKWWIAPAVDPLRLLMRQRNPAALLVVALAVAACVLKLSLWSIQTPSDLMLSVCVICLPYRVMPSVSLLLGAPPLCSIM